MDIRSFSRLSGALVAALLMVTGCAPASPYAAGKSAADVPAHADVIALKEVSMAYGTQENGQPKADPNPSINDQEVTAVIKRNIFSQLTNYGYKIVEPTEPSDVSMRFYIYYIPERWPLIGRSVSVIGTIEDANGAPLLSTLAHYQNTSGLVGAIADGSRDAIISSTARDAVIKLVTELRKGTKNNVPVTATVAPQPAMITPPPTVAAPLAPPPPAPHH